MSIREYVNEFWDIIEELNKTHVNPEHGCEPTLRTALKILEERAADRRMVQIQEARDATGSKPGKSDAWKDRPASEAQKFYMSDLGIRYSEKITQGEADQKIKAAQERPPR